MKTLFAWWKRWIKDIVSTNLIIVTGVYLSVYYVVWSLFFSVIGRPVDDNTLNTIGLFLAGMLAGGVTQFGIKRKTHKKYAEEETNGSPPSP